MQKYCLPCSETKSRDSKRKWLGANPLPAHISRARGEARVSKARLRGKQISSNSRRGISWMGEELPSLNWIVRISHPFLYGLSKNAIYRMGIEGHVALRKESRSLRDGLALHLKSALGDQKVYQGKVWLDIFVQKPNHRGDAVNVVDTVCDAVKSVVGVDDRWYSIRRLDWEISKTDPRIYLGVGQDIDEDHRVCSCCGRALPYSNFWGKKTARECIDCRSISKPISTIDEFEMVLGEIPEFNPEEEP